MSDPFELEAALSPDEGAAAPPPKAITPNLDRLNEGQRQAVEAVDGPVLVLAGAGTGKTRVLTTRLAHILVQGRARPWEVVAVTFTNKAAKEMGERVAGLLGSTVEGWWIGTFHALSARILRRHAEMVGLRSNFTILDADDQQRLVKQLVEAFDIDDREWPPRVLLGVIQRWKDRGLVPDKVSAEEGGGDADGAVLKLYAAYQERLKTLNAADFGDLLLHCLTIFQNHADVLAKYQRQFRFILVDEYQDTNVAQYLWLRLLAQEHKNICCVGDDDQSIYSWRGAEVGNILRFETDFPGAQVVRLEKNYRSTPHILGAASGLIDHNEGRLGKTLWTDVNDGEMVRVMGVWDGQAEARAVGEEIEVLQRKEHTLQEMAVLVRAGFQTREFEERLITLGIPYRVIGGPRFYERMEIRDAVAYMRVIGQADDDLAFERIVNLPKRGLGQATLQTLHLHARAAGQSLTAAARDLVETDELKPKARSTLAGLLDTFERWRALIDIEAPADLAAMVLDESGYTEMWQNHKSVEAPGRLDNLRELVTALDEFDTLAAFLEHVSLVMENEENTSADKVNLMTLHGAKGLEFDTVFLPGWEEGLFPHQRAMDEEGRAGLEEERRLAYVGLTRARHRAIISFAANRQLYGRWQSAIPSRFIDELPGEHVDVRSESGLYGEGSRRGKPADSDYSPWGQRREVFLSDGEWQVKARQAPTDPYAVGQRVFHQKFGYGNIVAMDGNKLEIAFDKAGTKKVMDSFVAAA
jgi:DNA helicase-2/ATP-dependent DNA helicase PcrA